MAFQLLTIECKGCGASVSLDPAIRSGVCPYCGSSNTLEVTGAEALQIPAVEEIFPARISEESFRNSVRAYLCTDPDVPDSLYETLEERELLLTFVPLYKHTIDWSANWSADIGYEDEESGKVSWQGSSGQTNGVSTVYSPGSSYLVSREFGLEICTMAAESDASPLKFRPDLLQGVAYLNCDTGSDDGEKEFTMPQLDVQINNECVECIPGEYQKNLHYTHRIHDRHAHLQLVPFWLFVYEWEGCSYYCLQDACSGKIAGSLPTTSRRKAVSWLITLTVLAVLGVIAYGLSELRSPYDAGFFLAVTYPLAGLGLVYRELVAFQKSKVKFLHETEICQALKKIKNFEAEFLFKAGLGAGIWIGGALFLLFSLALILPFWREPERIAAPERPVVQQQREKKVIRLKKQQVKALVEEVVDDDGNIFVIEK